MKQNILLVICDTLRPDFLSCYGGDVEASSLERIAEDGLTFTNAFAAGPYTPISHAALFSGQYPSETGVDKTLKPIPEDIPLLASWLRKNGYNTYGIAGPGLMASDYGFDRGFDEYFEAYDELDTKPSLQFLKQAILDPDARHDLPRLLKRGPDKFTSLKFRKLARKTEGMGEPWFAMCNVTTVHAPYDPPRPYKCDTDISLSRSNWFILDYLLDLESLDETDIRPERVYKAQTAEGIAKYFENPDWLTDAELDVLREWYKASIRYLDAQLESLFDTLDGRGELDDTIVILTSDHGEHFGEHGLVDHAHHLFDECLRVPLIISGHPIDSGQRDDLVSLIDVFPSICDLADLRIPDEVSGNSLFSGSERGFVCAEYGANHTNPGGHWSYLSEEAQNKFKNGRKGVKTHDYMYEITSDNEERVYRRPSEVVVENPNTNLVSDLRNKLNEEMTLAFSDSSQQQNVSESVKQSLEELGYL